jgi:hypothetical protein
MTDSVVSEMLLDRSMGKRSGTRMSLQHIGMVTVQEKF